MVEEENNTLKCYLLKMLNEIWRRIENDMNLNKIIAMKFTKGNL